VHFPECLQTGAPVRTPIADGVAAQKLADAAAKSLTSGQAVSL
jgi:myo-inositol 2-dehydrogenase/D-chiro-inositol 1-dehydrogenase